MENIELKVMKLYCCGYLNCCKEFSSSTNLRRHYRICHLRVREAKFPTCGKLFKNKQNLREHLFIHTNLKPYKCEGCDVLFRHKTAFLKHKKSCLS